MKAIPLNRVNAVLLFAILICIVLYYAREVLVVIAFSVLFTMLMTPVANKLETFGVSRILSTCICLLIIILVLSGGISLITMQVLNLMEELPTVQEKFEKSLQEFQAYIYSKFQVSPERQIHIVKAQLRDITKSTGAFFRNIIMGFTGTLASLAIILLFMFLMLLEREKYKYFLLKIYRGDNLDEASRVIDETSRVAQRYLWGRFLSIIILTVLYTIGLLIIGIENAFLLSAIAALLTIIPYIGPFIGGFFPFAMALVMEDSYGPAMWVAAIILFIQLIDNYFMEPYVVGGAVNLSMLFTILILIVGGYIWGIAGVILFLPLFGIVKVICDNVNSLRPYGYLIGNHKNDKDGNPSKALAFIKSKIKK